MTSPAHDAATAQESATDTYAPQRQQMLALGHTPAEVEQRLRRELEHFEEVAALVQPHWETVLPGRTWTAGQESEHIIKVNEGTARVIALLLSNKELQAVPHVKVETDEQGRRRAPAYLLPSEQPVWSDLKARHEAVKASLLTSAAQAPDEHSGTQRSERQFWHPAMGELTALEWLRMAAYHTRLHRQQLEKLLRPEGVTS